MELIPSAAAGALGMLLLLSNKEPLGLGWFSLIPRIPKRKSFLCDLVRLYYEVIRARLQSAGGFPKARSCPTSAYSVPCLTLGRLEN